jgi:hypothetical protein
MPYLPLYKMQPIFKTYKFKSMPIINFLKKSLQQVLNSNKAEIYKIT